MWSMATVHQAKDPLYVHESDDEFYVRLALHNVGAGIALIDPAASHIVGWPSSKQNNDVPCDYASGTITNPVVPPRQQAHLEFRMSFAPWFIDGPTLTGRHRNDGEFFVDVTYGDARSMSRTRARFHVSRDAKTNGWSVFEIAYFSPPDAGEPSVSARF